MGLLAGGVQLVQLLAGMRDPGSRRLGASDGAHGLAEAGPEAAASLWAALEQGAGGHAELHVATHIQDEHAAQAPGDVPSCACWAPRAALTLKKGPPSLPSALLSKVPRCRDHFFCLIF